MMRPFARPGRVAGGVLRYRNLSSQSTTSQDQGDTPKKLVFGLKKKSELGLQEEDADADMNIDVLAVMHKSNARFVIKHYKNPFNDEEDESVEKKEKHQAPQHRRFLTHPKVGPGTPMKREKMSNSAKLDRATAMAHKYQMVKLGFTDTETEENSLTRYKGIASVVEDKIQLAILQGDFDKLEGAGKPLPEYQNPLVDRMTDMAHDILRKNGVRPEWVELQQSMNALKDDLRARLRADWAQFCLEHDRATREKWKRYAAMENPSAELQAQLAVPEGQLIMPTDKNAFCSAAMAAFVQDEKICNVRVDAYNLQVPSHVLTRGRVMLSHEVNRCCEEIFPSAERAQAIIIESQRLSDSLKHYRSAVLAEMYSKGQVSSLASPGQMYRRSNQHHGFHNATSNSTTGAFHYATVRDMHDDHHNRGGSGRSNGGLDILQPGDLLLRSLMAPVDVVANALMNMMQKW